MCHCNNRPAEWNVTHPGGLATRCTPCLNSWLDVADEFPTLEPIGIERISVERPS